MFGALTTIKNPKLIAILNWLVCDLVVYDSTIPNKTGWPYLSTSRIIILLDVCIKMTYGWKILVSTLIGLKYLIPNLYIIMWSIL